MSALPAAENIRAAASRSSVDEVVEMVRPVSLTVIPLDSVIGDAIARDCSGVLVFIVVVSAAGFYAARSPARRRGRVIGWMSPPAHAGDEARASEAGRRLQCLSF